MTRALLRSGAHIGEMNTLRKHLSRIKGGRLARAAYPAKVVTCAISDVPGDDPAVIGSGPTVPDPKIFIGPGLSGGVQWFVADSISIGSSAMRKASMARSPSAIASAIRSDKALVPILTTTVRTLRGPSVSSASA